jgi:Asp-tRNA(Asn)/Glu-tRNA(Gln) amidotransferase A subunit family amidase
MWTVLHQPVVNVPGFTGLNGLPIGLSAISGRYQDRHLLEVAKQLGQVFGKRS